MCARMCAVCAEKSVQLHAGVAVAFQANDLPNPLVEVSTIGRPSHMSWTKHTLNPKFPTAEAMMYDKLPSDTIITFKLFDNKGTVTKRRRRQLLGSSSVCCTHITGEEPLYVWLPMRQPTTRHRRRRAGLLPPPGHVPDLQASHTSCVTRVLYLGTNKSQPSSAAAESVFALHTHVHDSYGWEPTLVLGS